MARMYERLKEVGFAANNWVRLGLRVKNGVGTGAGRTKRSYESL